MKAPNEDRFVQECVQRFKRAANCAEALTAHGRNEMIYVYLKRAVEAYRATLQSEVAK